jgi:hypothetical protein
MLAFHGDPNIKAKYLERVRLHAAADEIIHGKYWGGGKGCAVGCTIHGSNHAAYEKELGIPIALARLEDTLFEGMTNGHSKEFPERFLQAAKVGADLSRVQWHFLYWLLTEELAGRNHDLVRDAVAQCANVIAPLTKGEPIDVNAAVSAARSAAASAESAVSAAVSAAESAAWSAAVSAAESAAWSAAASAVSAAGSAAWSAESAARSAAWSAWSAAEREQAYYRMAEKLLGLMASAPNENPSVMLGVVA